MTCITQESSAYSIARNGHGLAQALYVGSLIADLIVDGEPHEDLEGLWMKKPEFPRPTMAGPLGLRSIWTVDRFNDLVSGSRRNARRGSVPVA
ncbi:hypothetical protein [Streptomyces sp. NPDC048248]|uniref:hypothetical protein n=1 Tax=Streptomyces sp. NPDC048248 TaxID=3365523 RepID=UPI003712D252